MPIELDGDLLPQEVDGTVAPATPPAQLANRTINRHVHPRLHAETNRALRAVAAHLNAFEATRICPDLYGAVGDGITDDTDAVLAAAHDAGVAVGNLGFRGSATVHGGPGKLYAIDGSGLVLPDLVNLVDANLCFLDQTTFDTNASSRPLLTPGAGSVIDRVPLFGNGNFTCPINGVPTYNPSGHNAYGTGILVTRPRFHIGALHVEAFAEYGYLNTRDGGDAGHSAHAGHVVDLFVIGCGLLGVYVHAWAYDGMYDLIEVGRCHDGVSILNGDTVFNILHTWGNVNDGAVVDVGSNSSAIGRLYAETNGGWGLVLNNARACGFDDIDVWANGKGGSGGGIKLKGSSYNQFNGATLRDNIGVSIQTIGNGGKSHDNIWNGGRILDSYAFDPDDNPITYLAAIAAGDDVVHFVDPVVGSQHLHCWVNIPGAGAAGQVMTNGRIIDVIDANTARLDHTASTTVTGAAASIHAVHDGIWEATTSAGPDTTAAGNIYRDIAVRQVFSTPHIINTASTIINCDGLNPRRATVVTDTSGGLTVDLRQGDVWDITLTTNAFVNVKTRNTPVPGQQCRVIFRPSSFHTTGWQHFISGVGNVPIHWNGPTPQIRVAAGTTVEVILAWDGAQFVATTTTYPTAARAVTPDDYGAVGDGVTNDSAAFTAALAALSTGGVLTGRAGKVYAIDQAGITMPDYTTLIDMTLAWKDGASFTNGGTGVNYLLTTGAFCQVDRVRLYGRGNYRCPLNGVNTFTPLGGGTNTRGSALLVRHARTYIGEVHIENFAEHGYINSSPGPAPDTAHANITSRVRVLGCGGIGYWLNGFAFDAESSMIWIGSCRVGYRDEFGSGEAAMSHAHVWGCETNGVELAGPSARFHGQSETNGQRGIYITANGCQVEPGSSVWGNGVAGRSAGIEFATAHNGLVFGEVRDNNGDGVLFSGTSRGNRVIGAQVYDRVAVFQSSGQPQTFSDGAGSATTNPTTFTTANTALAKLNNSIVIQGAGAAGVPLVTTITAINPGVSVTLADPILTTVSGATFRYAAVTYAFREQDTATGNAMLGCNVGANDTIFGRASLSSGSIDLDTNTAAGIRSQLLLAPYTRSTFSDADVTMTPGQSFLVQVGTLTQARTVTLPAANAVPPGWPITVGDSSQTVTPTNTLTIATQGSDRIKWGGGNVVASLVASGAGLVMLRSDGNSRWVMVGLPPFPTTGWGTVSGALSRSTFNTATADLATTAQTLGALLADLRSRGMLTS